MASNEFSIASNMGWQCPACRRCFSPVVQVCSYCPGYSYTYHPYYTVPYYPVVVNYETKTTANTDPETSAGSQGKDSASTSEEKA